MVITDAVTHRHPELARCARLALSHAIIVGEPIKPSILFQDQDGEIRLSETHDEVEINEIGLHGCMLAYEFGAPATVSFFPARIDLDGVGIETIVIVTHDYVEEEASVAFCLVGEDEETGAIEVSVLDEDGLREVAGA